MKIKIVILTFILSNLSLMARDKVIRKGMIVTDKDTIEGFLDISTDFNYQVYYKNDSSKRGFKKVKSKHLITVMYDDKVFEWIDYRSKRIMSLKVVEGNVSLYADFLPSITPGNNSSMFTSTQTNKTIKVYYLLKKDEAYELSTKNFEDVARTMFSDKPLIYIEIEGLSYHELFDQLPKLTAKYNQL